MRYVPALILDAVFVLVFAVIGRASHQENPGGFLVTAWPFLVALLLGHLIGALLPARPRRPWSLLWGVAVWVVTVVGGILLRLVSGGTAQIAFVIVATITLGVLLVGWRAVAAFLRRRAARGGSADHVRTSSGRAEEDAVADEVVIEDADPEIADADAHEPPAVTDFDTDETDPRP